MLKNYKGKLNGLFKEYSQHIKISYCPGETLWDKIHGIFWFVIKEMNFEDIYVLYQYWTTPIKGFFDNNVQSYGIFPICAKFDIVPGKQFFIFLKKSNRKFLKWSNYFTILIWEENMTQISIKDEDLLLKTF